MLRIEEDAFGAPRGAVVEALKAEGVPCSAGYGLSLYKQPMFQSKAFGPYLAEQRKQLDYSRVHCANSDLLCREQALWLEQAMFLGPRADMNDIAGAFQKIHENGPELADWWQQRASR
jgi:hypothetical protein